MGNLQGKPSYRRKISSWHAAFFFSKNQSPSIEWWVRGRNSIAESTFSFLISNWSLGHLYLWKNHKNLPRGVTWKDISRWKSNLICILPPQNYACKFKTHVPLSCFKILSEFDYLSKKLQYFTSKGFSIKKSFKFVKGFGMRYNTSNSLCTLYSHLDPYKMQHPSEQWRLHFT